MAKQNVSSPDALQKLPSVDALLKDPELEQLCTEAGRQVVVDALRQAVNHVRQLLIAESVTEMDEKEIHEKIIACTKRSVKAAMSPYFRKVVNATGIILHTGFGRAVLSAKALNQIQEELSGYSLLQIGIETGKRSKRDQHIERWFALMCCAERHFLTIR